jgi:hypothetical protein
MKTKTKTCWQVQIKADDGEWYGWAHGNGSCWAKKADAEREAEQARRCYWRPARVVKVIESDDD